ncbi:MAG: hypothetical protein FJ293_06980 [Planctomycetes bacterium]|nr:hypothetical protein [Planctomycetota bacterium]
MASRVGVGHTDSDVDLDDLHHGGHAGHDTAIDGDVFLKLFTLKTIVAFLTFFGAARSTSASRRAARDKARSPSPWTAARSS